MVKKAAAKPVKRKGYVAGGVVGAGKRDSEWNTFWRRQAEGARILNPEAEDRQTRATDDTEGKAKGGKVRKVVKPASRKR